MREDLIGEIALDRIIDFAWLNKRLDILKLSFKVSVFCFKPGVLQLQIHVIFPEVFDLLLQMLKIILLPSPYPGRTLSVLHFSA
jgi:hypothetical protein